MKPATRDREYKCTRCLNTGWVCEVHDRIPWGGEKECGCGGAGMPCPSCNVANADNRPRMPPGFIPDIAVDDEFPGLERPKQKPRS